MEVEQLLLEGEELDEHIRPDSSNPFTTPEDREAWEWCVSTTCVCGKPKKRLQSLCNTCYFQVPFFIREELWRPFADGFAGWLKMAREHIQKQIDAEYSERA